MTNSTTSIQEIFAQKDPKLTDQSYRYNSYRSNGLIETVEKTHRITKADLPSWLQPAVQSDIWAVRYARLLEQAPLELRALVSYALKNARDIYHYMNKACSKANWAETMKKWRKALTVERIVPEVIKRIGATKSQYKAIYKAVWRSGEGVIRHAVAAQELGRDKFKLFCWLVWKSKEVGKLSIDTKDGLLL